MIDKRFLLARLEQMIALPSDWDGFGTEPLSGKVFVVAKQLLEMLPEDTPHVDIFVGINNPGSLYIEIDLKRKIIEMTILDDGVLHFHELSEGVLIGSGAFYLTRSSVDDLLS